MRFTTVVKVVLEEDRATVLPNVRVGVFDRDRFSKDDLLGTGVTDAAGEVQIEYSGEQFQDAEDRLRSSFPELFAVVYGEDDQVLISNREGAAENWARRSITVCVPRETAERAGLLARA